MSPSQTSGFSPVKWVCRYLTQIHLKDGKSFRLKLQYGIWHIADAQKNKGSYYKSNKVFQEAFVVPGH